MKRLADVWPTVPKNKIQDVFRQAKNIKVLLEVKQPSVNGDDAVVVCQQTLEIASANGQTSISKFITFNLKKIQGKWAIESLSVK